MAERIAHDPRRSRLSAPPSCPPAVLPRPWCLFRRWIPSHKPNLPHIYRTQNPELIPETWYSTECCSGSFSGSSVSLQLSSAAPLTLENMAVVAVNAFHTLETSWMDQSRP